jgi:hypothetical protein
VQIEAIGEFQAHLHTCADLTELRISILGSFWGVRRYEELAIEECCKNSGSCRCNELKDAFPVWVIGQKFGI